MKIIQSILTAIVVFLISSSNITAQVEGNPPKFDKDFWKDSTSLTELTEEEKKESAVFLKDYHIKTIYKSSFFLLEQVRFIPNVRQVKNLYYKRIRLNTDEAVEEFNKVYISNGGYRSVTNLKARAITKDGTIINFNDSNKKYIENYENAGPFTIFALEGIEVGSEIEYTYTTNEPIDNFYFSKQIDGKYSKRDFHFELVTAKERKYVSKSYNGAPDLVIDTANTEENRYVLDLQNVKLFKEEDYSLGSALKQKIEVKLQEDTEENERNFYSWNTLATNYANSIYNSPDASTEKKETKAIKKFLKKRGVLKMLDQRDQIIALEHYLKKEFNLMNGNVPSDAKSIIKNKMYTEYGATRLMIKLLKELGIEHQLVFTSDRFETPFDGEFESYNFLETFLIYIPKFDQYIAPTNMFMRFGLIPNNYTYTKGLFLKSIELGGVISAFPEIKDINGPDKSVTYDNLIATLSFNDDLDKINGHLIHKVNGYSSSYIRPVMVYLTEEQRIEMLEEKLKQIGEDAVITNITSTNEEMTGYILEKPYIFEGDVTLSSLIENAGDKILLKVGQVIGAQMEMYADKERKYGVENPYNHGYNRVIKITIPEGYEITNLDDLNMNFFSMNGEKRVMEFISSYEIVGNVLTITCNEFYDQIRFPLSQFEEFRKVINAAADFNKITLVFQKK